MDVPEPVKRQLRQEAGFGCCKCGLPVFQYHHIIPREVEDHNRPEDVMVLCPNHHWEVTSGAMLEDEQRRYKARSTYPHYRRRSNFTKIPRRDDRVTASRWKDSPATAGTRSCRPRAAGGRPLAGLEFVEKLLPTNLTSTDTTERNAGMLRVPHRRIAGRPG
jgi:hypothetical protein